MGLESGNIINVNGETIKLIYVSPNLGRIAKSGFKLVRDSQSSAAIVEDVLKEVILDEDSLSNNDEKTDNGKHL